MGLATPLQAAQAGMLRRQRGRVWRSLRGLRAGAAGSTKPPGDVALRQGLFRCREDLACLTVLNEIAGTIVAHGEEGGRVGDARCLLHVVRDNDDGVLLAQGAKQDCGLDGDRARDAEPLLLPTGERGAWLVELLFDLFPERRLFE